MLAHKRSLSVHQRACRLHGPQIRARQLYPAMRFQTRAGSTAALTELQPREKDLLQQIMNYQCEVDLPEGRLVISALRPEWLQRAAELLTESFVDAKGIQPYRRYVRRNITKYLEQHVDLPPAAVVLMAVLHSKAPLSPEADLMLGPALTGSSSSGSSNGGSNGSNGSNGSSSSGNGSDASQQQAPASGWSAGTEARSTAINQWQQQAQPPLQPWDQQQQQLVQQQDQDQLLGASSSSSNSSSSSSSQEQGSVGSLVLSALQQLSQGLGLGQQQQQYRSVETLLGVAEVSFREHTRSKSLTLNPPKVCAYLCNMAVSRQWQRRGVATRLIGAVEDMCLLAGELDLFLHLRFKDKATAGNLYSKAGFSPFQADWAVLALLGQEPRYLMRKQLQPDRQLLGRLRLPAGVTVADSMMLLQQQNAGQEQEQQASQEQGMAQEALQAVTAAAAVVSSAA